MPERTSEIEWKLRAKDETGPAYDSARERLEEFIHHNAKTSKLLHHALEGAGAGFIADKIGESMSKVGEAAEKLAEALSHVNDRTAQMQGLHDLIQGFVEDVPVLGALVKGFTDLDDGMNDLVAAQYRLHGATEQQWKAMMSDVGLLKFENEQTKALTEAIREQVKVRTALNAEKNREPGTAAGAQERAEAKIEYDKEDSKLAADLQALNKIVNPTTEEKKRIEMLNQMVLDEKERYALKVKHIDEEIAHDEEEAFKARNLARVRQAFEADQKALDAEAQASAQHLRLMHRDSEAEGLLLQRRRDAQLAQIEQTRREGLVALEQSEEERKRAGHEVDPLESRLDRQELDREAKRAKQDAQNRFAADQAKLQQDAKNQQLDEQAEREKTLASLRIDLLRQEGQLGNEEAKRAAELLALSEKYADKRNEINRLLREGHDIPQAERDQLQQMLKTLDAQEKQELARSAAGGDQTPTNPFATGAGIAFGSTGSREAFAAGVRQNENDQRRQQQQMVDGILKSTDWLNKIWQLLNGAISGTGPASAGFSPANLGS